MFIFIRFGQKLLPIKRMTGRCICVSIIRVFMYEGKSRFSSLTPFIVTFLWGSAQRRNGKHSLIVLLRRPRHGRFCLAVTSWRDPIPRPKSNPWVLTNQHSQTQNKIRYSNWVVKGKTQRILISVMNSDTCHFIRFLMNQIKYSLRKSLALKLRHVNAIYNIFL